MSMKPPVGPNVPLVWQDFEERLDTAESRSLRFPSDPPNVAAIQPVTDPSGTYGTAPVFGNAASFGFSGTGSPLGIFGALGVHHKFGDYQGLSNADILKTTQGFFANTEYWGRTVDDSAQGGNCGVYMKDTGTPYTQAEQVTAFETDLQIEGNVTVSGDALAHGSRLTILSGGSGAQVIGQKADLWSANNKGSVYGTATSWKAFYDDLYNPAGSTFGANESVHGYNIVTSEQGLSVGRTNYGGSFQALAHGSAYNGSLTQISTPNPSTSTAIADGAFTNTSRLMTTATAPTPAWLGRTIANANVTAGTQVFNYYGSGPYTVVMTAAATGTASAQSVTLAEPDLTALRINMASGQTTGNAITVFDTAGNQRFTVSRAAALIMNGQGITVQQSGNNCVALSNTGYIQPGVTTTAGAGATALGAKVYSGTGAPALVGVVGDLYFRTDGGVGTTIYRCTTAGAAGVAVWTAIL